MVAGDVIILAVDEVVVVIVFVFGRPKEVEWCDL
jgi:hypothetical protein